MSRTLLSPPISSAALAVGLLCAACTTPLAAGRLTIGGTVNQSIKDGPGPVADDPRRFMIPSANRNGFGIGMREIHVLLPPNVSEDDGGTEVHGSARNGSYTSQSPVPKPWTLIFAEDALMTMERQMDRAARRLRTRLAREFQKDLVRMLSIAQLLSRWAADAFRAGREETI